MKANPKKWQDGYVAYWQFTHRIAEVGAWEFLDRIDALTDLSADRKEQLILSKVSLDLCWWKTARRELADRSGQEDVEAFWREFDTDDGLSMRGVTLFGQTLARLSFAYQPCQRVDYLERRARLHDDHEDESPGLEQRLKREARRVVDAEEDEAARVELSGWLYGVIKARDRKSLVRLADLLEKWPEGQRLEDAFPPPNLTTAKANILRSFVSHLRSHHSLPSVARLRESEGVTTTDHSARNAFNRDIRELGLNGLPSA